MRLGEIFKISVVMDIGILDPNSIGVELVVTEGGRFVDKKEFTLAGTEDKFATYELKSKITKAGILSFGIRVYPKHDLLAHRQDFAFVKWI